MRQSKRRFILTSLFCLLISISVALPQVPSTTKEIQIATIAKKTNREVNCLASVIYTEARNEPTEGQKAVAFVVFNRMRHFHSSLCEVVLQKVKGKYQFNGMSHSPKLNEQNNSFILAEDMLNNPEAYEDNTKGAMYFHAKYVHPKWYNLCKTVIIGNHVFYCLPNNSLD